MTKYLYVYFIVCTLFQFENVSPKVFTKGGLTTELLRLGFERSFVGNWICLIESESAKNTSKALLRADGSTSLGIFQIKDRGWCRNGGVGGKCNMDCKYLLNEDIADDAICARRMYDELGFRGWEGWVRSCKGRNLALPRKK